MGLVTGGALGRTVDKDQALVWSVPQHWTLEDAATVPLSYALAYYCLVSISYEVSIRYRQKLIIEMFRIEITNFDSNMCSDIYRYI